MKYTQSDDVIARGLVARNAEDIEFYLVMGRSKAAVVRHLIWLDSPEVRLRHASANKARREGKARSYIVVSPRVIVPHDCLTDATRRLLAPRSLTSQIFGDPAPGQSALDRREVRA